MDIHVNMIFASQVGMAASEGMEHTKEMEHIVAA